MEDRIVMTNIHSRILDEELPTLKNPLSNFPLFKTDCIDDAHRLIDELLPPHKIRVINDDELLDVSFDRIQLSGLSLVHVSYGSSVVVTPSIDVDTYFLQTTMFGSGEIIYDQGIIKTQPGDTVLTSPSRPYHMRLGKNCSRLLAQIDSSRLKRYLSSLLNDDITEEVVFDVNTRNYNENLSATINYIMSQAIAIPEVFSRASIMNCYSDLVISTLLELQPHNYSSRLSSSDSLMLPRQVKKVIDYIEGNIKEPLSLIELAKISGVSVRTLQRNFMRHVGKTPTDYIRREKLSAIHRKLLTGDRSTRGFITKLLLDYSISDFGRFSKRYYQQFGCTPSATLKKSN